MGGGHCTLKIFVNLLSSVLRSQTIFSFASSVVVARLLKKVSRAIKYFLIAANSSNAINLSAFSSATSNKKQLQVRERC
mgnify:CR=1 FL=1